MTIDGGSAARHPPSTASDVELVASVSSRRPPSTMQTEASAIRLLTTSLVWCAPSFGVSFVLASNVPRVDDEEVSRGQRVR